MGVVDVNASGDAGSGDAGSADAGAAGAGQAGYRRSAGSPRGEARRRELLDRVTEDLAVNGLVDFSLRRAARAAGTTHKVLLYHFDGADDLLKQAILQLRDRRIGKSSAAAGGGSTRLSLGEWVRVVWPILVGEEARVLDQAIGLAMYDPERYAELGRGASRQYLPTLLAVCPEHWADRRKLEVAEMILAVLRGFLVDARTSGDLDGVAAGFDALTRALEREEAADA
ncbi:TetR/AcrR family transcriptional regulator [Embleya sp. NPDC020886]|uniref:TetR/AcrR family transcriptional regulator n=1 Tax=Embleya sp. NPDC020886 TaxID=3363980 RepID=UPI0037AB7D5B